MKRISIKKIFLVCLAINMMGGSLHAAIGDWFARQKQRSSEYLLHKIDEAEQKTRELLASLQANSSCLVRGDCPPEKKKKLRAIVGAIVTIIAIIVAAAIGRKYMQDDEPAFPPIEPKGEGRGVEIADFYSGYDVRRQDPDTALLQAVNRGHLSKVTQYADLVKRNVLDAATRMAKALENLYTGAQAKEQYQRVKSYLEGAQAGFDEALQRANEYLLNATQREDEELVRDAYCGSPTPSKNAVVFGIETLIKRGKLYAQDVYESKIRPIIDFLRNPVCNALASG